MDKYNYYILFEYKGGVGAERIRDKDYLRRTSPLDSELALIEEHERLEGIYGKPVVILDWKRID